MNMVASFWKAVVFWFKDFLARFRSGKDGFAQVPVVVFLALMALVLPLAVMLAQNRQDTGSRAGYSLRVIWGRVRTSDGRYWANSKAETSKNKENLDPQLAVHFYNEGDSGYDITDAEVSRWLYSYGGSRRPAPPKNSLWEDNVVDWFFRADLKAHDKFFARVIPVDGYECDTWEYWIGDPDGAKLEDSGTGCRTSVFGMSYSGGRVYFTLKPSGTIPTGSAGGSCDCANPQDNAAAKGGDFDCNGTVDVVDFSDWVMDYVSIDGHRNLDCDSQTQVVSEFSSWLTGYLNSL